MRALVALVALAASWGCGPTAPSGCKVDRDCGGGETCARDGSCLPASQIRMVKVTWTIRGQIATATTCGMSPALTNMELIFSTGDFGTQFGYEPVPCVEGQFTIDKIPTAYSYVEMDSPAGQTLASATIQADNTAKLDLSP
jgi:hypothetical protein